MNPSKFLLLIVAVVILRTLDGQNYLCYDQDGNFTSSESYGTTLDTLLGSITTTTSDTLTYGLFNVSASQPQDPDDIQVLGVCRGDVTGDECRDCLNATAHQVRELCPTKKQATLFEDKCWIRYSSGQLYGVVQTSPYIAMWNTQNVSDWDRIAAPLKKLLDSLRDEAASGGPIRKYAANTSSVDLSTLYGLVQCSPDLNDQQCSDCLEGIISRFIQGKVKGEVLSPSCRSRFETFRFSDPVAVPLRSPPPPPSALGPATLTAGGSITVTVGVPPPPPSALRPATTTVVLPPPPSALGPATTTVVPPPPPSSKKWIIIGSASGSTVIVGVFILVFLIAKKKKHPKDRSMTEVTGEDVVTAESLQFHLDIIRVATSDFSEANKLGQGGFGSVYRGKLPSGQEIAVKRLSLNSGQGQSEFMNEARLLSRLQHRNLVRLLGYSLEGIERLLVYEFAPNSSLDRFIFDPLQRALLDWDTRYKIITGIARGLLYLHEDSRLRIIHRDLKAGNILLDMDMNPKVADFGMARLFEFDQTWADTGTIMGTHGYMAPEYLVRGHYSLKSDVFSFGVLVLEIVSGQRNLGRCSEEDSEMLISHAWTNWREGNISNIVDPAVSSVYSANIRRCIHIGLLCVQENEMKRPTMASVVFTLNSHSVTLPVPTQPAFLMNTYPVNNIFSRFDSTSRIVEANRSGENAGTFSINEASITEPYPR